MTFMQLLKEVGDTPPPELTKHVEGNSVYYAFNTPTGVFLVTFDDTVVFEATSYDDPPIPEDDYQYVTMDNNGKVHGIYLTFGKRSQTRDWDVADYSLTDEGISFLVMRGVTHAVETFIREYHDFSVLVYSSSGVGRTKAYNFLTRKLSHDNGFHYHANEKFEPGKKHAKGARFFVMVPDQVHTIPFEWKASYLEPEDEDENGDDTSMVISPTVRTKNIPGGLGVSVSYDYWTRSPHDMEPADWGNSETSTSILFLSVGKDAPDNEYNEKLYDLEKFNAFNGNGLMVKYYTSTIPAIRRQAQIQWPDFEELIEISSNDIDGVESAVKHRLNGNRLDYIIIVGGETEPELDSFTEKVLFDVFPLEFPYYSDNSKHYGINDIMQGSTVTILYLLNYDPQKGNGTDDWTSLPMQRWRDRQQDLPFGL